MFLGQNSTNIGHARLDTLYDFFFPTGLHVLGGDLHAADPLDASHAHRTLQIQVSYTPKKVQLRVACGSKLCELNTLITF